MRQETTLIFLLSRFFITEQLVERKVCEEGFFKASVWFDYFLIFIYLFNTLFTFD